MFLLIPLLICSLLTFTVPNSSLAQNAAPPKAINHLHWGPIHFGMPYSEFAKVFSVTTFPRKTQLPNGNVITQYQTGAAYGVALDGYGILKTFYFDENNKLILVGDEFTPTYSDPRVNHRLVFQKLLAIISAYGDPVNTPDGLMNWDIDNTSLQVSGNDYELIVTIGPK